MILDVPYHSQYLEVPDPNWNIRSCGVACLKMILDLRGAKTPDLYEFVKIGESMGAYGPHGWIHDKLIELAKNFGVEMYREEKMDFDNGVAEIVENIKSGKPVIASVIKRSLGQTKYHMVVITGFEEDEHDDVIGLYFHEPESTSVEKGLNLLVTLRDFESDWRRMAIFLQ